MPKPSTWTFRADKLAVTLERGDNGDYRLHVKVRRPDRASVRLSGEPLFSSPGEMCLRLSYAEESTARCLDIENVH